MSKIEVDSSSWSYAYGLMNCATLRANDGKPYCLLGDTYDSKLGLVHGEIHRDIVRGDRFLYAVAFHGGRKYTAREKSTGAFSQRALSRWLNSKAVMKIRKATKETQQ